MSIAAKGEYNLNIISLNNVPYTGETTIKRYFWYVNPLIVKKLYKTLESKDIKDNILDVGCGTTPFEKATHLIDFNDYSHKDKIVFKIDLDFEKIPYGDKFFNYIFCRHLLEDIQNPINAFSEMVRVSKLGYIETPSPLVELCKGVSGSDCVGFIHHRYIVWSDLETNTLNFLPKYPAVESIKLPSIYIYMLNNFPIYWNNYYIWNDKLKPDIVVYRNDINFDFRKDYNRLLNEAIEKSMLYTNRFIQLN